MDMTYFTAKRANPQRYPSMDYMSIISGRSMLHYDAEGLLQYLASQITSRYFNDLIILRNNLPKEETALRKTLETMIGGHNLILKLGKRGQISGRKDARKVLNKEAKRVQLE